MKIIFLDIDGVLNSQHTDYGDRRDRLDSSAIAHLNTVVQQTGARIVLTSDWRRYYGLPRCIELVCTAGLSAEIIDATPNLERRMTLEEDDFDVTEYFERLRRSEIEAWIAAHDVRIFVVLDDLAVFQREHPNIIITNPATGLTAEDAARATAILGIDQT